MAFENGNRIGVVDYSKQAAMNEDFRNICKESSIIIIGTGGIGFWVGIHAAMLGFNRFVLYDGDSIDATNLNRIPVGQGWLGKPKVTALKSTIRALRPDTAFSVHKRHFAEEIDLEFMKKINNSLYGAGKNHLMLDCTDNAFTQKMLFSMCKDLNNFKYNKLGYEGYNIGAYTDYSVWIDEEGYTTGYRTSKANSISSSVIASLGLLKALTNKANDMDINILDLVGDEYEKKTQSRTV